MGWLSDFTKNCKLKTSFILYMLISLIFSIPIALMCQLILIEIKRKYIMSKLLSHSNSFLDKIIFSSLAENFIDFLPIIIIMLFFYLFFKLFYKDKIKSILKFLDNYQDFDLIEKNELSDKVFKLLSENERLKKENYINIRRINDLYKEKDMILHEIKNPLTVLSGDLEMLSTIYRSQDTKVNRILERMSRSEKRIRDYLDRVKESENISELEVDIKEITYEDFIKAVKREVINWGNKIIFYHKLKDLTKTVKLDIDVFLEGLINIIKNSDTHAKSKIFINIYEDNNYLILEVEDDGPGFSQDALNNYNKAYFTENPLVGNMGLGLYITDEIMKKLDIEMVLANKSGANIRFFIKRY